jgi:hypothetical protein
MHYLEELYLSGNKLTSIPAEDFPRLVKLNTLFLNGNKLHTLPQELGKVVNLTVLDVGSNYLKYNINNWEFDWNWCVSCCSSCQAFLTFLKEFQHEFEISQLIRQQTTTN